MLINVLAMENYAHTSMRSHDNFVIRQDADNENAETTEEVIIRRCLRHFRIESFGAYEQDKNLRPAAAGAA